jgi:hypothetical protein
LENLPVVVPSPAAAKAAGMPALGDSRLSSVTRSETMAAVRKPSPIPAARYDPPLAVQSAIVLSDAPYRALPQAEGPPDSRFLIARVDGYTSSSIFEQRMAQAEMEFMAQLTRFKAAGPVTASQIEALIMTLGERRYEIQRDLCPGADASDYGQPIDKTPGSPVDHIQAHASNRHYMYFDRADRWARSLDAVVREDEAANGGSLSRSSLQEFQIMVDGVPRVGSFCAPHLHDDAGTVDIQMCHPGGDKAAAMRRQAYHLFADVANSPDFHLPGLVLTEQEAMTKLGVGDLLLMHATPFVCGSPSVVETAIDGILRSSYGLCLPDKKPGYEPFWEAMFTPVSASGAYARQFRNFYC